MDEPVEVSVKGAVDGDTCDEVKEREPKEPSNGEGETTTDGTTQEKSGFHCDLKPPIDSLDDLDDYSLTAILERLCNKDRFRLMRVNSRWYRVVNQIFATTKILILRDSFSLWNQDDVLTSDILISILKRCPSVEYLDLSLTGTTLTDKDCSVLRRRCPRLKRLICRDSRLTKSSVTRVAKLCPTLKMVDFTKCYNVTEKNIWKFFNNRPDIQEVVLSGCVTITGRCFYLAKNLKKLNLGGCGSIHEDSFLRLSQNCSRTLRTLIAPAITSISFRHICQLFPNLVHLEIDRTSGGHESLQHCRLLSNLPNLRTLIIRPILEDLNDETFNIITSSLVHLRELYLFGNCFVTDYSVSRLADNCPDMKILNLEGFSFGDRTLRTFARLQNIEQLLVAGSAITDEGAYHIMSNLPKLELLGLDSCRGIGLDTLSNAFDLVSEGFLSKKLIICYNNNRVKINELKSKLALRCFEPKDIWGSMDFEVGLQPGDDCHQQHQVYDQYDQYDNDDDDDDVIYDGDFDDLEEELS